MICFQIFFFTTKKIIHKMGLTEKRLAKEIQDNDLPTFISAVQQAAGFELKVEIDWDSFTAYDTYPLTRLRDDLLPEILTTVQNICIDDMGKDALKAAMTTIRLENTDDSEQVKLQFADKVLYQKAQLAGSVYSRYNADNMTELLLKSL
jgi:hypothetical protein